jgi:hypothetical protein
MSGDLEIVLRADVNSAKPYWIATAREDDSPMWDATGPTPDMALFGLAETLFQELMDERQKHE